MKKRLYIAAAAACVIALGSLSISFVHGRAILPEKISGRPTPENDDDSLIWWTEPSASGYGQFTTVRLNLRSGEYALQVLINSAPKGAPEAANARLEPVLTAAKINQFLVGINATPFTLPNLTPEETEVWKSFIPGLPVTLRGFAQTRGENPVGDGPAAPSYPILWEAPSGLVDMTSFSYPGDVIWALSAYHWLVKEGDIHKSAMLEAPRKYRSCVGLSRDGHWIYLVACGPSGKDRHEAGATNLELAEYLISLGADRAINFDGGSSSSLVIRQPDGWITYPPPRRLIARPVPVLLGIVPQ